MLTVGQGLIDIIQLLTTMSGKGNGQRLIFTLLAFISMYPELSRFRTVCSHQLQYFAFESIVIQTKNLKRKFTGEF